MPPVTLTAQVSEEIASALRDTARAADRSISAEIRVALRRHLSANDGGPAGTRDLRNDSRPVETAEHAS